MAIIGELSTRYGVIVLEDMAYFCMDFRQDLGQPLEGALSAYGGPLYGQLHSYAVFLQNLQLCRAADGRGLCVRQIVRHALSGVGRTLRRLRRVRADFRSFGAVYDNSGCTASTQYGYAEMLRAATDGEWILQPTCVNMPDGLNG